jgi:uncharacterized coiled-coil DUF342 family protein
MELTSLNQQRKQLMQDVAMLKNYRDYCMNQTMQKVSEFKQEYGDHYFSNEGKYQNKPFTERFHGCLNAMVNRKWCW